MSARHSSAALQLRGWIRNRSSVTPSDTITHLVQAGVDLPTVKRISGHKTLAMVERYAHQSGTHIADALEKLDDRYRVPKRPG